MASPRVYRCTCGHRLYFRNSECLACAAPLGFLPSDLMLHALQAGPAPGTWRVAGRPGLPEVPGVFTRCANFNTAAGCNWLVPLDDRPGTRYCIACALNRTVPDLSDPGNAELWGRLERAKRRLVSQLLGLGLPVTPRSVDPVHGLAYDFLRTLPGQPRVMTGHTAGIITINIEEADDAKREAARQLMREPYRTLLGHFRHEIGHYYWDRLVAHTHWLAPYRVLFGDERRPYGEALRRHHHTGSPPDWPRQFISSYASAHPWEDWAETWAHYLHLRDTIDTAASFGLPGPAEASRPEPFRTSDLWAPGHANGHAFLRLLHDWIAVTSAMNEMSRAMGQPDFYPFVLQRGVVAKLHFIHCVVEQSSSHDSPRSPL
ncbi:zinc-binding metallopeptidase family protein [Roseateles amylovorans]|uniref:Zinc-binding peptidase n=1 Tax=Roseateles amylovorans TaxID=2978473 RepID=A0ABY6ATL2_9BURK|nr:putative zinc-binding metallopeptidase [Roseateles amylovorans]UXH76120.1 putative zinc-binding peptidase [Roseateles amylovorans]